MALGGVAVEVKGEAVAPKLLALLEGDGYYRKAAALCMTLTPADQHLLNAVRLAHLDRALLQKRIAQKQQHQHQQSPQLRALLLQATLELEDASSICPLWLLLNRLMESDPTQVSYAWSASSKSAARASWPAGVQVDIESFLQLAWWQYLLGREGVGGFPSLCCLHGCSRPVTHTLCC